MPNFEKDDVYVPPPKTGRGTGTNDDTIGKPKKKKKKPQNNNGGQQHQQQHKPRKNQGTNNGNVGSGSSGPSAAQRRRAAAAAAAAIRRAALEARADAIAKATRRWQKSVTQTPSNVGTSLASQRIAEIRQAAAANAAAQRIKIAEAQKAAQVAQRQLQSAADAKERAIQEGNLRAARAASMNAYAEMMKKQQEAKRHEAWTAAIEQRRAAIATLTGGHSGQRVALKPRKAVAKAPSQGSYGNWTPTSTMSPTKPAVKPEDTKPKTVGQGVSERVKKYDKKDNHTGRQLEKELDLLDKTRQVSAGNDFDVQAFNDTVVAYTDYADGVARRFEKTLARLDTLEKEWTSAKTPAEKNSAARRFNSLAGSTQYKNDLAEYKRLFGDGGKKKGTVKKFVARSEAMAIEQNKFMEKQYYGGSLIVALRDANYQQELAKIDESRGYVTDVGANGQATQRQRTLQEEIAFRQQQQAEQEQQRQHVSADVLAQTVRSLQEDPAAMAVNTILRVKGIDKKDVGESQWENVANGLVVELLANWQRENPSPSEQLATAQAGFRLPDQIPYKTADGRYDLMQRPAGMSDKEWGDKVNFLYQQGLLDEQQYQDFIKRPDPKTLLPANADVTVWSRRKQQYEDSVRKYLDVGDPGLLGDVAKLPPIDAVLNMFGSFFGAAGLYIQAQGKGELGINYKSGWNPGGGGGVGGGYSLELTVDDSPEAVARQAALKQEIDQTFASGDIFAIMRLANAKGNDPFKSGSFANFANLYGQMVVDPTNFIPMNIFSYLKRASYAAEAAGRVASKGDSIAAKLATLGEREATRFHSFMTVSEDFLRARDELTKVAAEAAGVKPAVMKARIGETLAGLNDVSDRAEATRRVMDAIGLTEKQIDGTQVANLVEQAINAKLSHEAMDTVTRADEIAKKGAEEKAKAAAAVLARKAREDAAKAARDLRVAVVEAEIKQAEDVIATVREDIAKGLSDRAGEIARMMRRGEVEAAEKASKDLKAAADEAARVAADEAKVAAKKAADEAAALAKKQADEAAAKAKAAEAKTAREEAQTPAEKRIKRKPKKDKKPTPDEQHAQNVADRITGQPRKVAENPKQPVPLIEKHPVPDAKAARIGEILKKATDDLAKYKRMRANVADGTPEAARADKAIEVLNKVVLKARDELAAQAPVDELPAVVVPARRGAEYVPGNDDVGSLNPDVRALERDSIREIRMAAGPVDSGDFEITWHADSVAKGSPEADALRVDIASGDSVRASDARQRLAQMAHDERQQMRYADSWQTGRAASLTPEEYLTSAGAYSRAARKNAQYVAEVIGRVQQAIRRSKGKGGLAAKQDELKVVIEGGNVKIVDEFRDAVAREIDDRSNLRVVQRVDDNGETWTDVVRVGNDGPEDVPADVRISLGEQARPFLLPGSISEFYNPLTQSYGHRFRDPRWAKFVDKLTPEGFIQFLMSEGEEFRIMNGQGKGPWAFRQSTQGIFELFHATLRANSERLPLLHDLAVQMALTPSAFKLEKDLESVMLARLWLLMESRAGLDLALPFDIAEHLVAEMAPRFDMIPSRTLSMFPGSYVTSLSTTRFQLPAPIERMREVSSPYFAEPPGNWKGDGPFYGDTSIVKDLFAAGRSKFSSYAKTASALLTHAVGTHGQYMKATRFRAQVLENGLHRALKYEVSKAKVGLSALDESKFVNDLYDVYSEIATRKKPGVPPLPREEFIKQLKIEYGRAEKWGVGKKLTTAAGGTEFVDYGRIGAFSGSDRNYLQKPIREAFETLHGRGSVAMSSPGGEVMMFLTHVLENPGSYTAGRFVKRANRFVNRMATFGMERDAALMMSDMFHDQYSMFLRKIGDQTANLTDADAVRAAAKELLDTEEGRFWARTGKTPSEDQIVSLWSNHSYSAVKEEVSAERGIGNVDFVRAEDDAAILTDEAIEKSRDYVSDNLARSSLTDLLHENATVIEMVLHRATKRKTGVRVYRLSKQQTKDLGSVMRELAGLIIRSPSDPTFRRQVIQKYSEIWNAMTPHTRQIMVEYFGVQAKGAIMDLVTEARLPDLMSTGRKISPEVQAELDASRAALKAQESIKPGDTPFTSNPPHGPDPEGLTLKPGSLPPRTDLEPIEGGPRVTEPTITKKTPEEMEALRKKVGSQPTQRQLEEQAVETGATSETVAARDAGRIKQGGTAESGGAVASDTAARTQGGRITRESLLAEAEKNLAEMQRREQVIRSGGRLGPDEVYNADKHSLYEAEVRAYGGTVSEAAPPAKSPAQKPMGFGVGKTVDGRVTHHGEGWKIHIPVDPANYDEVIEYLERNLPPVLGPTGNPNNRWKNLAGGEHIDGKDFTVYIGSRDAAEEFAADLTRDLGHVITDPPPSSVVEAGRGRNKGELAAVLHDDIPVGRVWMRFDVGKSKETTDFHQYGGVGHPWLNDDVRARGMAKYTGDTFDVPAAAQRARDRLVKVYGEFYTGTRGGPLTGEVPNRPIDRPSQAAAPKIPEAERWEGFTEEEQLARQAEYDEMADAGGDTYSEQADIDWNGYADAPPPPRAPEPPRSAPEPDAGGEIGMIDDSEVAYEAKRLETLKTMGQWTDVRFFRTYRDALIAKRRTLRFDSPEFNALNSEIDRMDVVLRDLNRLDFAKKNIHNTPGKARRLHAAETVREFGDDAAVKFPERMISYYAETPEQVKVEVARAAHRKIHVSKVKAGKKPQKWWRNHDVSRWTELNRRVTEAIAEVHGYRGSAVKAKGEKRLARPEDASAPRWTDKNAAEIAAKRRVLREWAAETGERIPVGMYDSMRAVLEPVVGPGRRAHLILKKGAKTEEEILAVRTKLAKLEAKKTLYHTAFNNPDMTPEDVFKKFLDDWTDSGELRYKEQVITGFQQDILKRYFEHLTGAKYDDEFASAQALQAHGTRPPFDSRYDFKQHQTRIGAWSPRSRDLVDSGKAAWSYDSQVDFFMANYRALPDWLSDPAIADGSMFKDHRFYMKRLKKNGTFDNQAMVQARLTKSDTPQTAHTYAHGDPAKGIEPRRDLADQRRLAAETWGHRVVDDKGNFISMPWLMTPPELAAYVKANVKDNFGDLIFRDTEIADLQAAMSRVIDRKFPKFLEAVATAGATEVHYSDVIEFAYEVTQELMRTKSWKSFWRRDLIARGLDVWSMIWRAQVMTQIGFVTSNLIDNPTKGGVFSFFRRDIMEFGSARGRKAIPNLEAIGQGEYTTLMYAGNRRSLKQRIADAREIGELGPGARDVADGALNSLANALPTVAGRVENSVKLRMAQDLYGGLWEKFRHTTLKDMDDELADLAIKQQVSRQLDRIFPTLKNAGPIERLLNQVSPFLSYNIKNKYIWIREAANHPVLLVRIAQAQRFIEQQNLKKWRDEHNGEDPPAGAGWDRIKHQFPLGEIFGEPYWLDLGIFSDAGRGLDLLYSGEKTLADHLYGVFRPFSAMQISTFREIANGLGIDIEGVTTEYKWFPVLDSDGNPNGQYERRKKAIGTEWGSDHLTWGDIFWPAPIVGAMIDAVNGKKVEPKTIIQMLSRMAFFKEFGTLDHYGILNNQYQTLKEMDPAAAEKFLLTPEGQKLKEYWHARGMLPKSHYLNPLLFENLKELDPKAARSAYITTQGPDFMKRVKEGYAALHTMQDAYDVKMASVPYGSDEWKRMKMERKAAALTIYRDYPELMDYESVGLTDAEWTDRKQRWQIDTDEDTYYKLFGTWPKRDDFKTDEAYQQARKEFKQARNDYLKANPGVAARLNSSFDALTSAEQRVRATWSRALDRITRREKRIKALQEAGKYEETNRLYDLNELDRLLLEREGIAILFDKKTTSMIGGSLISRTAARIGLVKNFEDQRVAAMDPVERKKYSKEQKYQDRMRFVFNKAKASGKFDPGVFYRVMQNNPDLREQWFDHNPGKREQWAQNSQYMDFWDRFHRLANAGRWDMAWDRFDSAPAWIRERYYAKNPEARQQHEQGSKYFGYMQRWGQLLDGKDLQKAFDYFDSLPEWVRDRYLSSHPDSKMGQGGSGKGGKWVDYGPSTGGPSLSDAQFSQYSKMMGKWVNLLKTKGKAEANDYFRSMPQWAQDFYAARHPDKALLRESDAKLRKMAMFFLADEAHQNQMLQDDPSILNWLHDNASGTQRFNAIMYLYQSLPDDAWIKRTFRDKYPEVFSPEAKGERAIQGVLDKLAANPKLQPGFLVALQNIWDEVAEAQKHQLAPPRQMEVDRKKRRRLSHRHRSAKEVAEMPSLSPREST